MSRVRDWAAPDGPARRRFELMLEASRLIIVLPVVFLLIDAAASFAYGCYVFITTISDIAHAPGEVTGIVGRFLIVMDTYLVGATLMVAAFGFYTLFLDGHSAQGFSYLPSWLTMRDLDDLKARVVSMLILVAAITFVDYAVETRNTQGVFWLGLGIALVITALTAFLRFGRHPSPPLADPPAPGSSANADDSLDH